MNIAPDSPGSRLGSFIIGQSAARGLFPISGGAFRQAGNVALELLAQGG